MSMRRQDYTAALAAAAVLLPCAAHAQTADLTQQGGSAVPQNAGLKKSNEPPSQSNVQEIVVTAQRREQRLQDVPVSVSVVTGAQLEDRNLRTLEDVADRLPDVKIATGSVSNSLNIRGIGSGSNPGFEQSVATFVDDLYRPRSYAVRAALFDISQIEVLKGPQTTFFGANAIAGALNITTRKPTFTPSLDASALYGSNNEYTVEAGITQPIIDDKLSIRLSGRAFGMDDFVDNVDRVGRGQVREYTGRFQVLYEPVAGVRSDFRIEGDRLRDGTAYDSELLNCPTSPAYPAFSNAVCNIAQTQGNGVVDDKLNGKSNIPPGYADNDYYEIGWTNSLDLGSLTLTSVTGFYNNKYEFLQNLVPTAPDGPDNQGTFPITGDESYRQFSQELRIQSPTHRPIEFLAGLYYQNSNLKAEDYGSVAFSPYIAPFGTFVSFGSLYGAIIPPAANPLGYNGSTTFAGYTILRQRESTESAFAAVTIRPLPKLSINGGLRYTIVSKRADRDSPYGTYQGGVSNADNFTPSPLVSQQILAGFFGGDLGNFPDPKRHDQKLMPSIGAQYEIARNQMLYATYTNGFKAGGFGGLALIEDFGPETVDAYEVGAKGSVGGRGTYALALFRSDYQNLQESSVIFLPSGAVVNVTTNAAAARSQGVESSFSFRAMNDLSLSFDAAYLDSRYQNFPNGACTVLQTLTTPGCVQDLSGKRRPYSPEFSGNVSLLYNPMVGNWRVAIEPLVYFTSDYFEQANSDNLFLQKAYAKVDLRLTAGPANGHWDISIVGKNLTDEQTASFRSAVPASAGSVAAIPDRGRSVTVGVRFHM